MKTLNVRGVIAAMLILTLPVFAQAAEPDAEPAAAPRLTRSTLPALDAARRPQYNQPSGQAPNGAVKPIRKRNKWLIALGLASIGGGVAMIALGPTSTSQSPYTTSTNVKAAGAIFAGAGAVALVLGLRGK